MPLFIDLHIDSGLTLDVIKQFHIADKATQARYGVRYLQILLNQPQGYLFCLVEGPDKESCARVHQEAHGAVACNILEITESDFSALLANKQVDSLDFTLNSDGTIDTGTRTMLYINLLGPPEHYLAAKETIKHVLDHAGSAGKAIENQLVVIFDSTTAAFDTAVSIRNQIEASALPIELRMALNFGPPLKEKGSFFEDVRKSVEHFAFLSDNGQITVSTKVLQLYSGKNEKIVPMLRVIPAAEEKFLSQIMEGIEKSWNKMDLTMEDLAKEVGMSKSQLARKLKPLSGLSPNDFVKEFKLRKAFAMMEDQVRNVAEISMDTGFSSPSYFSKCFRKRFGKTPSELLLVAQHRH